MRFAAGCFLAAALATAASAQPQVRFSPLESYTAVYNVTGLQTGTITEHSRKYGAEQSRINDINLGNGVRNRMQLITAGDRIITYDPAVNRAAAMANPTYQALAKVTAGKDPADLPKVLMQALSFVPTGRMQNIAGETCMIWESQRLSQTRCMTQDGIALETRVNAQGVNIVQTASSVRRGDPGPETAFAVPAGVQVPEVKSMNELPGAGR
jgi:hypothetical protein